MPIITAGFGPARHRVIVSLCDFSGQWLRPYVEDGYTTIRFDLKLGDDCNDVPRTLHAVASLINPSIGDTRPLRVVGVLAAPLCTTFTNSGARWWPRHEQDGTREEGVRLVPEQDRYTKLTGIWGTATKPPTDAELVVMDPCKYRFPLEPIMVEKRRKDGTVVRGSWMWANLGGKSERTKTLRSNTPQGFARAFADVNR